MCEFGGTYNVPIEKQSDENKSNFLVSLKSDANEMKHKIFKHNSHLSFGSGHESDLNGLQICKMYFFNYQC